MLLRLRSAVICLFGWSLCVAACCAQEIVNGSFTDGTAMPTGWSAVADKGRAGVVRDLKVYASAPASLRVDALTRPFEGKCVQDVQLTGPGNYRFKGKLKTQKITSGGIAMVMWNQNRQQVGWSEVAMLLGTNDWTSFDVTTFVPASVKFVTLLVMTNLPGPGSSLWVDDLSVKPVEDSGRISLLDFSGQSLRELSAGWANQVSLTPDGLKVTTTSKGGAYVGRWLDFSRRADYVPVIELKTLPGNAAGELWLHLTEPAGTTRDFTFKIPQQVPDFTIIPPVNNATLAKPSGGNAKGAPVAVKDIHLDSSTKFCALIRRIDLVPANEVSTIKPSAFGAALKQPGAPRQSDTAGSTDAPVPPRPASSASRFALSTTGTPPAVLNVTAESATTLAIELQSQTVQPRTAASYSPTLDDTQEDIEDSPTLRTVIRNSTAIGILDSAADTLHPFDRIEGISLTPEQLTSSACKIHSDDDRNYATALAPQSIGIKARPVNLALPGDFPAMRYNLYLRLPQPLQAGRNYNISFGDLPIKAIHFLYDPTQQHNEALHVNQNGFRPDDPAKVARLSLWLGTLGHLDAKPSTFRVLDDASGTSVFEGQIENPYPAETGDSLAPGRSLSQANVFVLDFSALDKPGKYRLLVPELGASGPFTVGGSAWEDAFTTVMRAFYIQRSGIEIGNPYSDFTRRRSYHALDGTTVRLAGVSLLETNLSPGGAGQDYRKLLARQKPGAAIPEVMGGYLESGTSTLRRIQHLDASRLQLELMILFPQYFSRLALSIPEAGRKEADLIDEALWNLEFYSKLQQPEGGVCGAVVDLAPELPYPLPPAMGKQLLALAPDVYSSYSYAATAAKAAVVLRNANPTLAQRYAQSAAQAMDWAEQQPQDRSLSPALAGSIRDRRNLAAAELLRLTGDRRYADIFADTTCLTSSRSAFAPGAQGFDQREAVFVYARLPETSVDLELRRAAFAVLKSDGDQAVALAQNNAWGLLAQADSPSFYSTQAVLPLLHAHYIFKDASYLEAAITHASFVLGGNPSNTSYITGLGWQSVQNVQFPYARLTQRALPPGLVVNGAIAPSHPGLLTLPQVKDTLAPLYQPALEQWPAAECLLDVPVPSPANTFSIHETLGPTAYLLGYLAAR